MALTITLPDGLERQLKREAVARQRSIEEIAVDLLEDALLQKILYPTPEQVVEKIRAIPPDPQYVHPAQGSIASILSSMPPEPEFDMETWKKEWAAVEVEMKAVTRANDLAEGRG